MRAKDWAIEQGLATAGRGRMSREAHNAIQKAIAGGMVFDDYTADREFKTRGSSSASPIVKHKSVKVNAPKRAAVMDDAPELRAAFVRYSDDQVFSYEHEGKSRKVSGRSACMNCGYSLIGHTCDSPRVITYHGSVVVRVG